MKNIVEIVLRNEATRNTVLYSVLYYNFIDLKLNNKYDQTKPIISIYQMNDV